MSSLCHRLHPRTLKQSVMTDIMIQVHMNTSYANLSFILSSLKSIIKLTKPGFETWLSLNGPVVIHNPDYSSISSAQYKKNIYIYSGYGKYSDPLKFFTLCYIAAICENNLSSFFSSLMYTQHPILTEKHRIVDIFSDLLKKKTEISHGPKYSDPLLWHSYI